MKNLIILSNSETVSSEEIENKLDLWELVGEVVITGEDNGLCAIVYPDHKASEGMTEEAIRAALQDHPPADRHRRAVTRHGYGGGYA